MAAEITSIPPGRFPTHHGATEIHPQARILCEIIAKAPAHEVEARLASSQIQPEPELVQQVMKHSYNSPSAAAKFFRWAGLGLGRKHTPYSWNLMVDLLGKNKLFEPMWDAVRSMKLEGLLSLTTFVSVFENYCIDGKFDEAIMSFDAMERWHAGFHHGELKLGYGLTSLTTRSLFSLSCLLRIMKYERMAHAMPLQRAGLLTIWYKSREEMEQGRK